MSCCRLTGPLFIPNTQTIPEKGASPPLNFLEQRQSTCTAAFVVDGAVSRAHSETKCENAATGPPLLSSDWLLIEALGRVLALRTPRTRMTGEPPCADSSQHRVWLYVMGVATDTVRLVFFLDGREREDAAPSRCPLRTHGYH
ncbi:hypothetical protein FQN60_004902 [Etheostoma spectabile]|uniref:Uncharacterized protein n=1 Tax=Etheostoma spectabile TaxID=54343 RepID=A0A5J5DLH2_9PERO|nr:hypothetical protein FQN60_004902 [Etheostoma spectabile]